MLFKIGVLIYGYFAGALIQAGYWMGKFNKIDIRDYGSGNAGTCLLYTSDAADEL